MATWLHNSSGTPVAFISDGKVISRYGRFIGRLDRNEIWHGCYKGEIVRGDRFLYNTRKGSSVRGIPGIPGIPAIPGLPGMKGPIALPASYRDVDLED